ncbi:MAG: type II secretion system protein [Thiobacillaceae bacterium]
MCSKPQQGLTLIELLVFIVIIGIAANAMLAVFAGLTRNSASLLPDKQAQAIASAMMNEILGQPFTFCDPDDSQATTATSATIGPTGCASMIENMGPEPGETRGGPIPFDNVNDYNGFNITGAALTGLPGLAGYSVQVSVAYAGASFGLPNSEALQVTVTASAPNGAAARLDGVRFRYTPTT